MGHVQSGRDDNNVANRVAGPKWDEGVFEQSAPTNHRKRFWHRTCRAEHRRQRRREWRRRSGDRAPPLVSTSRALCDRFGQYLVQDDFGLVFVGAFGKSQFADEDLASLREHALLAGRQAAVLVPAPKVARTTSATLLTSPDASFSPFAL